MLQPGLSGFDLGDHIGELGPDHSVGEQGLASDKTLVGPEHALLNCVSGGTSGSARHHPTFVLQMKSKCQRSRVNEQDARDIR